MRFDCFRGVILGVLMVLFACPAWGGDSLATIVFTGNSFGEFKPCAPCGAGAVGGLGRRAGYFSQVRSEAPEAVFVSGGYEFVSYIPRRKVRRELMGPLAEAYGMLRYDLGVALPNEAVVFADEEVPLPEAFVAAANAPWVRVVERNGIKLGFVGFPEKADPYKPAAEGLAAQVLEAAKGLRPRVDVVVGLSSWGERDEIGFAKSHPGAFDVLLGAGPGTGYGVRGLADGRTVWGRTLFDGRGVVRLDILALPGAGPEAEWREGVEYSFSVVELGSSVQDDAGVSGLFAWY